MKARAVLLALLMLPAPVLAQTADEGDETGGSIGESAEYEPWLNESLNVRVPIEISPGTAYPEGWSGPRLVTYEIDVTEALLDAGWPQDAATGQPQGFSLDEDSLRVVARDGELEPTPMLSWDGALLSGPSEVPTGHSFVTVAFLADPDIDEYHVYFDRKGDADSHEPIPLDPRDEQRILQLLAGPGAGHELYGIVAGSGTVRVASGYNTPVRVQQLTSQGWSGLPCGSSVGPSPGSWTKCGYKTGGTITVVRVLADKPVVAWGWNNGVYRDNWDVEGRFLPLVAADGGYVGETLLAPAAQGDDTPLSAMTLGGTCQATYGNGQNTQISDAPTRLQPQDSPTLIEAECPIIGWSKGSGPSPTPVALGENISRSGMTLTSGTGVQNDVTVVGNGGASALLINDRTTEEITKRLASGNARRSGHQDVGGTAWTDTGNAPHRLFTEGNAIRGAVWDTNGGSMPLFPTSDGAIGWIGPPASQSDSTVMRLAAYPIDGSPRISFAVAGSSLSLDDGVSSTIPVSETFRYGSDIPYSGSGDFAEAGTLGSPRLLASATIVDGTSSIAPSLFTSQMRSFQVERSQPQVIGPLFSLSLQPESRIAAPGEVQTFELMGRGHVRNASGEVSPLTVSLNLQAITDSEDVPDLDVSLPESKVELPLDQPQRVSRLTATVPSAIPPDATPSYRLVVSGTPVDGGDAIEARSTIQVIPNREISLTFADGSNIKDIQTDDEGHEAELVLSNEGTATEDVRLSTVIPEQVGWDVTLTEKASGDVIDGNLIEDLQPDQSRRLLLDIEPADDTARVVSIQVLAQSTEDASVSSEVTARVAHGVSVDVASRVVPDLVTLEPGDRDEVNLSLTNRGSPVNVRVEPKPTEGLILEPGEDSVNLGENGSEADHTSVPLNITVAQDAPIGGVLVSTIKLDIRVGDLEPIESLMSLRVRVVPDHQLEPVGTLELLPGLSQDTNLTVRATGDADENVDLSVLQAPQGWSVEAPTSLEVPLNTTAPVPLTLNLPEATEPGSYDLALLAKPDDGTPPIPIRFGATVAESPAFELDGPGGLTMGLGANRTVQLTVQNRGNIAGETTIETDGSLASVKARPATLTLGTGDSQNVTVELVAEEVGNGTVELVAPPGGEATIPLKVGRVELGIELVSTTPATPESGSSFRGVVRVTNDGTVAARNVDVSIIDGQRTIKTETIGRLAPGDSATLAMSVDTLPDVEDVRVVVDPDGRYTQETVTDDSISLSSDAVPMPTAVLWIALIAAAAVALRRT